MVKTITVDELKELLDKGPVNLIDVREEDEWQEWRIPGARLIPKDKVPLEVPEIYKDFNTPLYLHCKSGMRSQTAGDSLQKLGFTNVYSVEGGIVKWEESGYPIRR